jgi:hypothetical protein
MATTATAISIHADEYRWELVADDESDSLNGNNVNRNVNANRNAPGNTNARANPNRHGNQTRHQSERGSSQTVNPTERECGCERPELKNNDFESSRRHQDGPQKDIWNWASRGWQGSAGGKPLRFSASNTSISLETEDSTVKRPDH